MKFFMAGYAGAFIRCADSPHQSLCDSFPPKGEAGELIPILVKNCYIDIPADSFESLMNISVGIAFYGVTGILKIAIPVGVSFKTLIFIMLSSVKFYDKFGGRTAEINNIGTDRFLTFEHDR